MTVIKKGRSLFFFFPRYSQDEYLNSADITAEGIINKLFSKRKNANISNGITNSYLPQWKKMFKLFFFLWINFLIYLVFSDSGNNYYTKRMIIFFFISEMFITNKC